MGCECGARNPAKLCDQDELRIGVTTAIASMVIGVSGLMRNENGEDSAFDMRVAATSDRVETVLQQNIGAGHLIHAHAYVVSGTNIDRGVFVNARIVREAGATDQPQFTLFSGYLDGGHQPSFPYDRLLAPLEGPGRIRAITGTNQAVNTEITETVPAGAVWRLLGTRFTLVTDANVATRQVTLIVDDGANTIWQADGNATQLLGLTRNYNFFPWSTLPAAAGTEIFGFVPPNMLLQAGFRIRTSTANIQAGDDYGAPIMLVEEWLVP